MADDDLAGLEQAVGFGDEGGEDHVATSALEKVEQVNEEVGDGFIFAGLAAEKKEEFTAAAVADAVDDGIEGLELVVV